MLNETVLGWDLPTPVLAFLTMPLVLVVKEGWEREGEVKVEVEVGRGRGRERERKRERERERERAGDAPRQFVVQHQTHLFHFY